MFYLREYRQQTEFWDGIRDQVTVAMGIAAWGMMTGVAMVKSGMSVFEAVAMTMLVFAGSSQLAAIPLLVAGAPAWVILATGFCVNLRFVVFSLHLRNYLMHLPRWQRMCHGYFTADITYVLFTVHYPQPGTTDAERTGQEAYLAGNYLLNWGSWIGASLLGVGLANLIPPEWGLGFAGILCLLGIQCSLASSRMRMLSALIAAVAAVVAYNLPLKLNIVVAIAVAVILCMSVEKIRPAPKAAA